MSALPSYNASKNQLGVIRVHGSQLTINLIHRWEEDFLKLHPDIRYRENILPSWFSGLCAGMEDLTVMGHDA
jgi:phosphate transport system substrate-binding protein